MLSQPKTILCILALSQYLDASVINNVRSSWPQSWWTTNAAGGFPSTSVTLLFQNNLNSSDDRNHVGALLLDAMSASQAARACQAFSETLLSPDVINAHEQDFLHALSYVSFAQRASAQQSYYIGSNQTLVVRQSQGLSYLTQAQQPKTYGGSKLPVLCSQSDQSSQPSSSIATADNRVSVIDGTNNTYLGYRNQKSFRFLGIPYAPKPSRFEYSSVATTHGQTINATTYGKSCQDSEDCLFLNIQTPYLPKPNCQRNLRPVVLWIYGGAFISGSGSDSSYDGGNLASREDIVVVTFNYRLGSFGYLAVPNTTAKGNYAISDQESAIQWTLNNIQHFGGDPRRITLMGQSAGAQSVRAILSSPPANGKFNGAIVLSNTGSMGLPVTLTPDYQSIESAYTANNGPFILQSAGCTQTNLQDAVNCLKTANASKIGSISTNNALVQDGYYINSPQLNVGKKVNSGSVAHVPVIFGNVENDGATFTGYPRTNYTSIQAGLQAILGINASYAESFVSSGLYTASNSDVTGQAYNISQRIATDRSFRCLNQATVKAGVATGAFLPNSYYYQFTRTSGGLNLAGVPGAPVEPGYPYGDPEMPYYKLHASEFPWVFGNQVQLRDAQDLYAQQLDVSYFASFVKKYNPNPDAGYLQARGYDTVSQGLQKIGSWSPVRNDSGKVAILDFPPSQSNTFLSSQQCAFIGLPLDYYLK